MGERRDDVLAKRLPEGVRYVGVGVGRRWNRNLMKMAAERTGGYFTQINPDEPVSWRAFDLSATLNTPRLLDVTAADRAGKATFLTFTNMVAQGEELCAVARVGAGEALPEAVTVRGRLNGTAFERDLPVKDVTANVGHLLRTWARLEIERLLAEDAAKNKEAVVGLSKAMYVMTPYTSLLVLENEEMYQQYKVDRGRKDHWAMYPCPERIEVVYEPLEGMPPDPNKPGKPSAQEVARTVLMRSSSPQGEERLESSRAVSYTGIARRPKPASFLSGGESDHNIITLRGFLDGAAQAGPGQVLAYPDIGTLMDPDRTRRWADASAELRLDAPHRKGHASEEYAIVLQPQSFERLARLESPLQLRAAIALEAAPRSSPPYGGFPSGGTPDIQEQIAELRPPLPAGGVAGIHFSTRMSREAEGTDSLLYRRPQLDRNEGFFFDLVYYAPGMDTSRADLLAVLEVESAPSSSRRLGHIEGGAHRLFEKARPQGWRTLILPAEGGLPAHGVTFDASGRYAYERTLPPGIRERVVCDGKTLLHSYPDLGLGARRTVSRFHRLDFARSVPWAVPAPEDLAHGADLKVIAERTVAVVPHGAGALKDGDGKPVPYVQVWFLFAEDGRIAERQVIEMPAKKVLRREVYAADGGMTILDGDGKELATIQAKLVQGQEPDLKPDTRDLVVLSLPYRDAKTVRKMRGIENKSLDELPFDDALALLAAEYAAVDGTEALKVCRQSLFRRDQKQLGLYVLLAACGVNLDAGDADVLAEHLHEPLAQYLALHASPVLRRHASQWAVGSGQWREGYLAHLALTHALFQRWSNSRALGATDDKRREERDRALEYVRRNKGTAFAWGLLCLMKDRADEDEARKKDLLETHKALAEAWPLFEGVPALAYAAKYEHARGLLKSGRLAESRQRFRDLYEQTLKDGALPPIDGDFRAALLGDGKDADLWADLMRRTAAALIDQKKRPAVLALASQCRQIGDESLASHLTGVALDGIKDAKERTAMTLAAIDFLTETGQFAEADRLLAGLLDDAELAKRADLWRLAARLAERRDQPAREFECLERALDAEYRNLPEVINLKEVRGDYERLLGHYQDLANALVRLKMRPPADFTAKVVRTADRWRALDPEADGACDLAGRVLRAVGERELVWDYLTTPVGRRPNEAGPWVALANTLSRTGELDLADRAYAAAFAAEPTDAQILWDRAQNLRQGGKTAEAQKLYRQLAEGDWQPRFNWVRTQAKWQLEKR
jgi:Tfp pilus assembly protein PilF